MLEYPIYSNEPFKPKLRADGELLNDFIVGVDPGPERNFFVTFDWRHQRIVNVDDRVHGGSTHDYAFNSIFVVEKIMSYGMAVSTSIFKTVFNIGYLEADYDRYINEEFSCSEYRNWIAYVARKDVKMHFCHSMRSKDTNIRAALIDRFGEPGTKKNPGILYGIKKDLWAALAVAVYAADWLQEQQSNRIGG